MTEQQSTREIVYEALRTVEESGAQSHLVVREIERTLEKREEDPDRRMQDKLFALRLFKGVLETRLQLDYILDTCADLPAHKMKPAIRTILRMAVYQLFYLDSVPDRAAVYEAVSLTAQKGLGGLKNFVNAVLRRAAREKEKIRWPDPAKEPIRAISVRYSVPEELVQRWADRFGREKAGQICAAFLEERPLYAHCLRGGEDKGRILPDAVPLRGDPLQDPAFCRGDLFMQDLSSQIAMQAVGIRPGDAVLDLCAAPGGKTMSAAASCALQSASSDPSKKEREDPESAPAGRVLACDLRMEKVERIRENLVRCAIGNVDLEVADATQFRPEWAGRFDVVLADLPCSGYGVAGKKPEIKYKPYDETVLPLAELQRKILTNAVRYIRPGGKLLYSTCTITQEENEDNRVWLLTNGMEERLEPVDITQNLPTAVQDAETAAEGYLQLLPCDGPWDGFFFAVFKRHRPC